MGHIDHITTFDLVIALIIFFLGLKGLLDGFIKEFFGLAGIIGGIYYGSRYAQTIGQWINHTVYPIHNEAAMIFIGFLAGLFGIWFIMVYLGKLITRLVHASGMGFFNKLLGALFGWAKIFLIFSVIIYALSSMELTKRVLQKYTKDSILYPLLVKTGAYIIKLKPEDLVAPKVTQQSAKAGQEVSKEVEQSVIQSAQENLVKQITKEKQN